MKKIINLVNKVFNKFPLTFLFSILASLVYVIFDIDSRIFDILNSFIIPFCASSFLIETLIDTKKSKIYYLIPLFLGVLFSVITRFDIIIQSPIFIRFLIFYYVVVILLAVYFNYKKSSSTFSKYLVSCFNNFIEVGITYVVLNIGLFLILYLLDFLIFDGILDELIDKILVLIIGCYLVPGSVYALYDYKDVSKFINVLVTKVLFILVLIAYLIIYIYMFKIIITFTIPSNMIFRILSLLFIIGFVVNIMGFDIESNKVLIKIHKLLPYIFIPFILLQCYSLGIRIYNYGFTIIRYLGFVLIVFEIIYTVIQILKIDNSKLILVIILELFITLLLPFINCYDFSINNQYKYIIEYKNTGKVTSKTVGAYYYLITTTKGDKLIGKLLDLDDISKISKYQDDIDYNTYYYYFYNDDKNIDIEGYKTLSKLYGNYKDEDNKNEYDLLILDKFNACLLNGEKECFEKNNIIYGDDIKIVILSFDYNYGRNYDYCSYEYYLLRK